MSAPEVHQRRRQGPHELIDWTARRGEQIAALGFHAIAMGEAEGVRQAGQ
ncbi:hypothetical protein [Streptomyces sp. NPDC057545]